MTHIPLLELMLTQGQKIHIILYTCTQQLSNVYWLTIGQFCLERFEAYHHLSLHSLSSGAGAGWGGGVPDAPIPGMPKEAAESVQSLVTDTPAHELIWLYSNPLLLLPWERGAEFFVTRHRSEIQLLTVGGKMA